MIRCEQSDKSEIKLMSTYLGTQLEKRPVAYGESPLEFLVGQHSLFQHTMFQDP